MKKRYLVMLILGLLSVLGLLWAVAELAVENDGLKQVVASQRRSVQDLLKFAEVATRCDVTPEEVASALSASVQTPRRGEATAQVARLAFRVEFQGGKVRTLEITDTASVSICNAVK